MSTDPAVASARQLEQELRALARPVRHLADDEPIAPGSTLRAGAARELFEDQLLSRALDRVARELKQRGEGYYTIQGAGHEQNAVLGALLHTTDPALLHYRSGALVLARARQAGGGDPVRDAVLSLVASADDPTAEGRHKVWGSRKLWIIPQTSTVASHVPKATGLAFALGRARRLELARELPEDAIVCCSFGDASLNHAAALSGLQSARYAQRLGSPVPILFVCEDNGLGISVPTPPRWIESTVAALDHLTYLRAEGPVDEIWAAAERAIRLCRESRSPVFLHLPVVRLWGHAGSDVESAYRSGREIDADRARDPLVANARRLVTTGAADPEWLLALATKCEARVREAATDAVGRPKLATRARVMAPLAPLDPARCRASATGRASDEARRLLFGDTLPEAARAPSRRTLAAHINSALGDELLRRPELLVFGEDVGRKGGVYHVTAGLQRAFGSGRVFDTLLDETAILGVAQGAGLAGLLPVPEIQYLAYLANALDQLRGEAASMSFFSAGQFRCPMVVRVASFAYQKGFGGHFHNDNAIGHLRDIPGLVLTAPARGDDAARLLRGALALARECGRVVAFLEPIALYHEKDLHEPGDEGWLSDYPPPGSALLPGELGVYGDAPAELAIVSYANGLRMALRTARALEREHGARVRVLDLRWLAPLPLDALREHAEDCGRLLVVDECRASGGVADAIVAHLTEAGFRGPLAAVRAADSYVPLGPAADTVLLQEDEIRDAALRLLSSPG